MIEGGAAAGFGRVDYDWECVGGGLLGSRDSSGYLGMTTGGLAGGLVFGGFEDSGGELEVADVADDLVDLGLGDAGDGEHVAEGPVVLADAAEDGEVEGGVGVVAGVVDAVDEGGALVGADGGGAVALGAVGVEDCFALAGCLRQVRWASDGLGCGFVGCVRSRGFAAGNEGE